MIHIYIVIVLALILGALYFFPVYAIITAVALRGEIPPNMSGDWLNFIMAFRNWYLVIMIIIPLLLYVFVQSQKPKAVIIER